MKFIAPLLVLFSLASPLFAHDHDPSHDEWYKSLMMPDSPTVPCCGEPDAYWADRTHVKDGKVYAEITDDRDDQPLKRPHIPNGTWIEVPNHKLKYDAGNPTGHSIIFVSLINGNPITLCFVQGTGS